MSAFLCRVCGGALELVSGKSLCSCPYCGTMQSVPLLDSEEKAELCRRAEQLRREFRYDKAMALYERLIGLSPTDADLYWALTLCRCGAELSPDGSVLLNRICAHSVLSDEDYKLALKFADDETRVIMERQAEQIDIARRSGIELAGSAEYDVYLCAREADENGRRVMDSVIAAELYTRLCAEGLKVFFPQKSLEDKFGGEWEPYIFAALSSAEVMAVVGTSTESFDEVWVRNAWSRFSKPIIPVVRDMSPSELPDELAKLQVLDMSRLGAENDLVAAIKALTGKSSEASETITADDPLLRRAALLLEDGDFGKAEELAAQLLSKSPNNAEVYVIKLLAELGLPNEQALDGMTAGFSDSENYRLAMLHGGEPLRHRLKEHHNRAMYAKFTARLTAAESSNNELEILAAAAELETLGDFSNAAELSENAKLKVADMRERHRSDMYEKAVKTLEESSGASELRAAEYSLRSLGDYKDAPALAEKCAEKLACLSATVDNSPQGDEPAVYDKPRAHWKKYLPFAAIGTAALALTIIISAALTRKPAAILPQSGISENAPTNDKQAESFAKAAAALQEGNYSEAELMFTALGSYKNSAEMVKECKYQIAAAQLESGELDAAERAFERLGSYSDSPEMILQCKYQKAQRLLESGEADAARALFKSLNGKWESKKFIDQIDYAAADELLNAGEYKASCDAFKALGKYSDSAKRSNEAGYKYAAELLESGEFSAAADEFKKLGDYSDSGTQYCRAQYDLGIELAEQNELKAARLAFERANGYGDTALRLRRLKNQEIRNCYKGSAVLFEFGKYYYVFNNKKSSLLWEVYTIEGDMALVYACSPIDYMQFDSTDPNCSWQNSSLRRWLNGEFYETAFTDDEKAQIRTSVFETASGNFNYLGTSGSGISDKVFLLNTDEAVRGRNLYGELQPNELTLYARQYKLPANHGTLFCWGRDKPLINSAPQKELNATSYNCVVPAMWVYIGD